MKIVKKVFQATNIILTQKLKDKSKRNLIVKFDTLKFNKEFTVLQIEKGIVKNRYNT